LKFNLEGAKDRIARLTIHSSSLGDAVMTKEGDKLFYLSSFEKGYDLWMHDFKNKETKLLAKLGVGGAELVLSKDESSLFVLSGRVIKRVSVKGGAVKPVQYTANMEFDMSGEFEYMFDHIWRQTFKKFYVKDMHGVDWKYYGDTYRKFLPHINNGIDFAEMMSELLGELNASHTGARYFGRPKNGDRTGSLAIFPDYNYEGKGVKIKAILDKSELVLKGEKAKAGDVITKINGEEVKNLSHYYELMNHTTGKKLLVAIKSTDGKSKDEYVKPVGPHTVYNLLYEQWVKGREEAVKKLSGGKVGYVHVRGMNDASFRDVYSKALGKYCDTKGLIVDTRFNGGGWLHDDLATFLSGKDYADFVPRGQHIGHEPLEKWYKPHCVLVGEGNYSDAHGFPFAYRALNLGKIIGMPIPGTMTAVWWERLINSDIVFGIPQVGMMDKEGKLQENYQLKPDIMIKNDYKSVTEGIDKQLEEAVKLMMK
jgi:tricorn protease